MEQVININKLNWDYLSSNTNAIELLKFQYQTRSGQTDQNADGRVNEPSANAADQLYNPTNLGKCHLTIVGDPAWLQQGEVSQGVTPSNFSFQPFMPDGTINFDSQQICFDISWNAPTDYNFNTGIMNVNNAAGAPQETGAQPESFPHPSSQHGGLMSEHLR